MDCIKNLKPIQLYMASVIFFIIANLLRKEYYDLYFPFLVIGVLLFFLGLRKRIKK